MKILIAGANGQLGRALQSALRKKNKHVPLPFSHQQLDVTDRASVERALSEQAPDAVINASAYNAVDKAEQEPEKAMALNKTGPENLARATREKKIRFIHVSTDYVFDGNSGSPYVESDSTNPLGIYGKSKRAGEVAVLENNPDSFVARTAWLYHVAGKNFPLAILALREKPEIRVVNDQFGSPTYAPHLADQLVALLEAGAAAGVYHLAGTGGASWYEFAAELFRRIGVKTPLQPIPLSDYPHAAPRPRFTVLSTERIPAFRLPPWQQGVADFAADFKEAHARTVSM